MSIPSVKQVIILNTKFFREQSIQGPRVRELWGGAQTVYTGDREFGCRFSSYRL